MEQQQQLPVPVRIYVTDNRIMVAAPLPGLEPADIAVTIVGDRVIIHGAERGPRQHERDLVASEWTIGPYYREMVLPAPVNGAGTNATYGNGVLVLAMPKLEPGQPGVAAEVQLEVITATRGERVGHRGRDLQATTTQEHRQRMNRRADNLQPPRA